MNDRDALIRENKELKARLELAQAWMRREVESAILSIKKEELLSSTRGHFDNIFEENERKLIEQKIHDTFGDVLDGSPEFTLERLIDAEIYWYMLQKFPHMDAFPIIISYQKILDAWLEKYCIAPWRHELQKSHHLPHLSDHPLDRDLQNVIEKSYTLSIGRWYKIILSEQDPTDISLFMKNLIDFWKNTSPSIAHYIFSSSFSREFQILIDREVFSSKRHERKVSFSDAKITRNILIGTDGKDGLLKNLFLSTLSGSSSV